MKYEFSNSLQVLAEDVSLRLFPHIKLDRIKCFRSTGTSTDNTIARCHGLGVLMQEAMGVGAFYALEFIREQFDDLSTEEKAKTVIHELMHIPEAFGGGFKHHDIVTDNNVDEAYRRYLECRKANTRIDFFWVLREQKK
ncbi:MAG: putative metallopeptidase [Nanoarchaeota archaeon]|jgi:predicted metallopeptidase|nr:putative metallopeptidase [Nanoarchaeota archaeon]